MIQPSQTAWGRSSLVYCSNVHPAESLSDVRALISGPLSGIRNKRSLPFMGSGLWLNAAVARTLTHVDGELVRFNALLEENAIRLITLNGFPYGDFHGDSVKERVYTPDWSLAERLDYTLQLATILARFLPLNEAEGTISTLPIGLNCDPQTYASALRMLCEAVLELHLLEKQFGRRIRLCLEMEPGCMVESTGQLIRLFTQELPATAHETGLDAELLHQHLGICFDVCHQAVMFEDPYQSLQKIHAAGIVVGKIQVSSALELQRPQDDEARLALAEYVEPRYLHQVRARCANGKIRGVMDLPQALQTGDMPRDVPWRVHFHVPIQTDAVADGRLVTTQSAIERTLDFLVDQPTVTPHLEVETYTWQVLPDALRPQTEEDLENGIVAELAWLESQMRQRHLLVEGSNGGE